MVDPTDQFLYDSAVPFDATRLGAAAVYCSDGRFGEQCDDFLHHALELPRYDRLAIPGGAACLASHFAAYREEDAVVAQLEFLIAVHSLRRVVLIAHQDCAFYTTRLEVSPLALVERQREDLVTAVGRVRQMGRDLMVDAFFAHQRDQQVTFEWVAV
ncbi:MAG: carbonic anhydrase [Planctomycetota bacterium]|jgi:hypothetical protein